MNAPRPPEPAPSQQAVQHLTDNVQFWRQQRARLERDRHNLAYLLYAALPTAAAVALISKMTLWALAAGGICVSAWALGMYMVTVRRAEYDFAAAEAERELRASIDHDAHS